MTVRSVKAVFLPDRGGCPGETGGSGGSLLNHPVGEGILYTGFLQIVADLRIDADEYY